MYESHFGLSASPFQLNPDPSFYFDSKGHSNALAYLRYGAYQAEGFIVVTGEIGAGKTTLVRALLSELDSAKIVAGQVVSTQLEAGDLLRSILTAFGVQCAATTSKAMLIATLEAFLSLVASKGQRALLVVDEAQNLNQEAVEELRMLSNFQFDSHALLQSFLVGQPDLRRLLHSKSMEQLRQRVIASCHLGPLDAEETQAYILHRLHHVGWRDRPRFDPQAFEVIHRWTGGIPRRINLLCNRLLLGAFLVGSDEVSPEFVERVVDEVHSELGEPSPRTSAPEPGSSVDAPQRPSASAARAVAADMIRVHKVSGVTPVNPVLCVASTAMEFLKARALACCLEEAGDGMAVVVVTPHGPYDLACDEASLDRLPAALLEVHLGAPRAAGAETIASVLSRFDGLLDELKPGVAIILGDSDAALACSLAANKRNVRVLHADGHARSPGERRPAALNGALIDRIASLIVTNRISDHSTLSREGIPAERVLCLGSLLTNVVQGLKSSALSAGEVVKQFGVPPSIVQDAKGYGLTTLRIAEGQLPDEQTVALIGQLKGLPPLLWLVDGATDDAIRGAGLSGAFDKAHVVLLPSLTLPDAVALLSSAAFLVCDAGRHLADVAEVLGVACIELGTAAQVSKALRDVVASRRPRDARTPAWDGGPGQRIAEQISLWLQP